MENLYAEPVISFLREWMTAEGLLVARTKDQQVEFHSHVSEIEYVLTEEGKKFLQFSLGELLKSYRAAHLDRRDGT